MDHLREAESPAAEPAVKVADGTPPPTAELPVLPTHYCKDMIYYFGSVDLYLLKLLVLSQLFHSSTKEFNFPCGFLTNTILNLSQNVIG